MSSTADVEADDGALWRHSAEQGWFRFSPPLSGARKPAGDPRAPDGSGPDPVRWRNLFAGRRFRGIKCWHGVPGSGKTYELARWAVRMRDEGREVWCSYGFHIPGARSFASIDDFVAIPEGAAIAVDEAPIWFDARAWKSMDRSVLVRLTQIRHYDIHLRYTAIHPSMVELRLRQITFEFERCTPLYGPLNVLVSSASPEGAPQLRVNNGLPRVRLMRPQICSAYNTKGDANTTHWQPTNQR